MGAGLLPVRLCVCESSLQRNQLFLKCLPFCFIVTLSFFKSDSVGRQLFFCAAAFLEHAFPEAHAFFRLGQSDVGCEKGFLLLLNAFLRRLLSSLPAAGGRSGKADSASSKPSACDLVSESRPRSSPSCFLARERRLRLSVIDRSAPSRRAERVARATLSACHSSRSRLTSSASASQAASCSFLRVRQSARAFSPSVSRA